jgi:hypothetical protein
MTAWRPRNTEEAAIAQRSLRNLEADTRARQHLQNLHFEQPVTSTAEAWLQNRARPQVAESTGEDGPPVSISGTRNGDDATPVEEPRTSVGP